MDDVLKQIKDIIDVKLATVEPTKCSRLAKDFLRAVVNDNWPSKQFDWQLDRPVIEESKKAAFGSGIALVFKDDDGVRKVLLGEAGDHYKNPARPETMEAAYTIPGGFLNLLGTKGSIFVPPSDKPENGRVGAARETEEEFPLPDGSPLLAIDPERLKPMDTDTLAMGDNKMVVMGFMVELEGDEIPRVKDHVAKMQADTTYRASVNVHSINPDSGKPEIETLKIFPLSEVALGQHNLLHKDQLSLFKAVDEHFTVPMVISQRIGPTPSYRDKVKELGELEELVSEWRKDGGKASVGITSGVFDILHPGHTSFLEDAAKECGHLIVIIASDRTTKEQKGDDRPHVTQSKRAQTIAALGMVDAVIISDEPYHETILKALAPDIMFKGHDYEGKKIIGADLVRRVALIRCAETMFYSSTAFESAIRGEAAAPKLVAG